MRMIVQSICHYLLGMVFRRRHASTMPLPPHGWTSAQTAKDAPFLRGVLLLRWAKSRLRLRELPSNHTAAVQGRVEVHVIAGVVVKMGGDQVGLGGCGPVDGDAAVRGGEVAGHEPSADLHCTWHARGALVDVPDVDRGRRRATGDGHVELGGRAREGHGRGAGAGRLGVGDWRRLVRRLQVRLEDVRHRRRRGRCRRGRRRGSRGRGRHGSRTAAGGDQDRRGGYASEYAHIRSSLWVHPLYGWSRRSDDEAEQAYKHGFCRGRSSLSSGGHPPPLAAYPGTARATPWSPYAALLQVALARFTPLARVRHCGAGLASRRRGVTPYLALWSPDFPRRLAPTRPSSLLGRVILAFFLPPFGRVLVRVRRTRHLANQPTCSSQLLVDRDPNQFAVIAEQPVARVLTRETTDILGQLRDVEQAAPQVRAAPFHEDHPACGQPCMGARELAMA